MKPGDAVLLCSDGVSNVLRPAALAEVAGHQATPQAAADALVQAALRAALYTLKPYAADLTPHLIM